MIVDLLAKEDIYTRIYEVKINQLKDKDDTKNIISFKPPQQRNLFFESYSENGKKEYNLFDYGCDGIKYTGAVEQALIDDVLEIKKQIKAMFDPITKMTKLDAALFGIGLLKCTKSQFEKYLLCESEDPNSKEVTEAKDCLVKNEGTKAISASKTYLQVLGDFMFGQRAGGVGIDTRSQMDLSGIINSIWKSMDEGDNFEKMVECTMEYRNEMIKKIYKFLSRSYKIDLQIKTLLGAQCNASLENGKREEETWDSLFGGTFSKWTTELVDSVIPGSEIGEEEISNMSASEREAIVNELNSNVDGETFNGETFRGTKNYWENTSTGSVIGNSCGPVFSNASGFYQNCLEGDDEEETSVTIPIEVNHKYGTSVAAKMWGEKKVDNLNKGFERPARDKKPYFSKDGNGLPTGSHEDNNIKSKILGNKTKIATEKFIYTEGDLTVEDIKNELSSVGLLYYPIINGIKKETSEPSFLANFIKNLNLFDPRSKKLVTNYFFLNKKMFEDNIDLILLNQKGINSGLDDSKTAKPYNRNLNMLVENNLKYDIDTINTTSLFNPNILNKKLLKNNQKIYIPNNYLLEIISTKYIANCNEGSNDLDNEKINELFKIINYYNKVYMPKIGLKALYKLYDIGINKNEFQKKYKIIRDKSEPSLLWVSETHLQYLLFRKTERKSIISMLKGFKCNLEEHLDFIKSEEEQQESIFNDYDKFSQNNQDNLSIKMNFSQIINLISNDTHSLRFNSKIDYYESILNGEIEGGKTLKYKYKLILKELERKYLDSYGIEEKIRDLNKRQVDRKATSTRTVEDKNNVGSYIEKKIEMEKIKYLKNFGEYLR